MSERVDQIQLAISEFAGQILFLVVGKAYQNTIRGTKHIILKYNLTTQTAISSVWLILSLAPSVINYPSSK